MKTLNARTGQVLFVFFAFIAACEAPSPIEQVVLSNEVQFVTADSVEIHGDLFQLDKAKPSILLFHQGGSNGRAEYSTIIERLKDSYNILSIDQRTGGQLYGQYNRTMARFSSEQFDYCDAYPDLEASLDYLIKKGFTGEKVIWGSSYSATLAIQLASKRADDVAATLAFSPASGGPMLACRPDPYFTQLKSPLLVLRPSSELQRESSQEQFKAVQDAGHSTYVAENGVHGSSLLVQDRVDGSIAENWETVLSFLELVQQ